ncbi:hypothetical protein GOP47_0000185 [Adiantum capillus-veneris]|uniref:MBD domain-containing protein n=1 Tax=Adiantum capillus-veneris TaxID=13818 RepID=A0A9D4VCK3_ADICA|nr:hypothetical protein GOP47_0000185 [Adiantum capillus-veneris]
METPQRIMLGSVPRDNRMCVNTWHHADNEMLNGFLRHSSASLSERCRYDSQDLMVTQTDCSRMSPAVSTNGSYLGYLHQGLYGTQGLAVSNIMDNGLNSKVVPRTWHPEKPPLDAQEYQCFVEEIKKTVQTWSAKHHCLVEASQSTSKNSEVPAPCSGISCLEPSWDSVLESSSHSQEEAGHSSRETPCSAPLSDHASEGVAADSSVQESQVLESACVFTRTSRRSNLYRRRALKKVENFCSASTEVDTLSPSLNRKGTESPSTSEGFGPIVESPDWLPQGWLTEMKTRASGTSAGCKYKCYVDPVTKRRFRTRKEVFCFLTTGNTGRYKPKSKVQQNVVHQNNGNTKHPVSGLQNILQGPNLADDAGGSHVNGATFLQRSWQYRTGHSAYGGIVNIQAAALKLLTDDDDMTLDEKARLFARFSPRPVDLYGLRIPTKNFKRMKTQGKEGLEALGKVICQQGLSILRKGND